MPDVVAYLLVPLRMPLELAVQPSDLNLGGPLAQRHHRVDIAVLDAEKLLNCDIAWSTFEAYAPATERIDSSAVRLNEAGDRLLLLLHKVEADS